MTAHTLKRAAELLRQYGSMADTVKDGEGAETLQVAEEVERMAQAEAVAFVTFNGHVIYAANPKLKEYINPDHLYAAPRLPRGVLMEVARDVHAAMSCYMFAGDASPSLDAIVDRRAKEAEPVNQQMLDALNSMRRELQSCQAVIHLAGGFDHAYVDNAKSALSKADAAIAAAESAQAQQPVTVGRKFFTYDDETGFDLFDSAVDAKKAAQASIDEWRAIADCDRWPEEIENVCWGVVLGASKEIRTGDVGDGSGDWYSNYILADIAQAQEGGAA